MNKPNLYFNIAVIILLLILLFSIYDFCAYINRVFDNGTGRFLLREDINNEIELCMMDGNLKDIYEFYDKYTNNREITHFIVNNALIYDVPVHITFAIGKIESNFYPSAKGINSKSYDIGIFQLNSNTFAKYIKKYGEDYLFDIKNNIKMAIEYMADRYKTKSDWIEVIIAYNRGSIIDELGIKYLVKVSNYERYLDREFNLKF